MNKDYYAVLGVSSNAQQQAIDSAYRRLAQKYHPAQNSSAAAYARMREINQAWQILSDINRRERYDTARTEEKNGRGVGAVQSPAQPDDIWPVDVSRRPTRRVNTIARIYRDFIQSNRILADASKGIHSESNENEGDQLVPTEQDRLEFLLERQHTRDCERGEDDSRRRGAPTHGCR